MIPLPVDPTVVVLTDGTGKPIRVATNVAPDTKVMTTQRPEVFDELAKGRPFIVTDVEQVWVIKD
jgi:hypothetical protein